MANPDPSPETRFGSASRPNSPGKTSEQRRLEIANAELATRMRARALELAEALLAAADSKDPNWLSSDLLRLIKDSEDRGLGQPVQPVDLNATITDMSDADLDAEIAAALAKAGVVK